MPDRPPRVRTPRIYLPRIYRPSKSEMRHWQEINRRAIEVLRQSPVADTFLGRKTQEPFPKEEESEPLS
jgi:hypothetical protein